MLYHVQIGNPNEVEEAMGSQCKVRLVENCVYPSASGRIAGRAIELRTGLLGGKFDYGEGGNNISERYFLTRKSTITQGGGSGEKLQLQVFQIHNCICRWLSLLKVDKITKTLILD